MLRIAACAFFLFAGAALAAPPAADTIGTVIKKSKASILLECGGKSYTLSTGTGGGSCTITKTGTDTVGACDDKRGKAGASCNDGCIETHGKGSCGKP